MTSADIVMDEPVEVGLPRLRLFWFLVAVYGVYFMGTLGTHGMLGATFSYVGLLIALLTLALIVRPWPTKVLEIASIIVGIALVMTVIGLVPAFLISAVDTATDPPIFALSVLSLFALLHLARSSISIAKKTSFISYISSAFAAFILCAFGSWSLLSGAVVAWQAQRIAAETPYCIAGTLGPGDYSAIRHLADLRGVNFHIYKTGFKDNSNWYFHGLLHAPKQPSEIWSWSRSKMSFVPIDRRKPFLVPPSHPCRPEGDFLAKLPL